MPGSTFSTCGWPIGVGAGSRARPRPDPVFRQQHSSTSRSRRAGADLGRQFAILVAEPDYCTSRSGPRERPLARPLATFAIPVAHHGPSSERARGGLDEEGSHETERPRGQLLAVAIVWGAGLVGAVLAEPFDLAALRHRVPPGRWPRSIRAMSASRASTRSSSGRCTPSSMGRSEGPRRPGCTTSCRASRSLPVAPRRLAHV